MRPQRRQRARRPGFTLIELLLAMGLFTVSMAMVAALFPAALYQAKVADEYTMATIIGENAIATIRARIPDNHLDLPTDANFIPLPVSAALSAAIHQQDMLYPQDPNLRSQNTTYGWVALVRLVSDNDYIFAVVPYAIPRLSVSRDYDLQGGNDLYPMPTRLDNVEVTVSTDGDYVTAKIDPNFIAKGSPVILNDGRYTFIIDRTEGVTPPEAVLSDKLGVPNGGKEQRSFWVYGGGGDQLDSPAIGCFTFRTSLHP